MGDEGVVGLIIADCDRLRTQSSGAQHAFQTLDPDVRADDRACFVAGPDVVGEVRGADVPCVPGV